MQLSLRLSTPRCLHQLRSRACLAMAFPTDRPFRFLDLPGERIPHV
jgi:hypothetical protein